MTTFTIEKLNNFKSEIVGNTPMNILVEIYNELSTKPVKKFTTKAVGLAKINKLIEMYELELDKVVDSVVSDDALEIKTSTNDKTSTPDKTVAEKPRSKHSDKISTNKQIKSLQEELKADYSNLNIRKFHYVGEDGKVVQNGETKLNVENTSRDCIFIKNGRDLKFIIVFNLDGEMFIDGSKLSLDELRIKVGNLNTELGK
jgi:hypothetical protein